MRTPDIKQILIRHWGFITFRPLQEDIINEVLKRNDTLALLPTGGGKSLCFQVPGLAMDGLTLVITPLIALMRDQVENLKKKGIKAAALHSGMNRHEIEVATDNCLYGDTKFLYVSPERLQSKDFREIIKKMRLSLLTVDEAHCISQWGYDFRPPYLKIAEVRELVPGVPVLALTATATPEVVSDIQEKLQFKKKNHIRGSFDRKNLAYVVIKNEDKANQLLRILKNVPGTAIIYVRNRRKTREIQELLKRNKISCGYYHAGRTPAERNKEQELWMKGSNRVMVATNAFGMGIDKPNVRLVVHMDLPDSLEAYFQEAGRAGRDEKYAYAVLIFDDTDIEQIKNNLEISFPPLAQIKSVYQALGNYFQLAVGSGRDVAFDFDIADFSSNYNFKPLTVFNVLKFLEKEGYLLLTEAIDNPSKLFIQADKNDLYRFQVENPKFDKIIKLILRSYSGLFSDFVKINENQLARILGVEVHAVEKALQYLTGLDLITYVPRKNKPQLIFTIERIDASDLSISKENYKDRKAAAQKRISSMISYVETKHVCRSQYLLRYFGERQNKRCGRCDVCRERNKIELNDFEFDQISESLEKLLWSNALNIYELIGQLKGFKAEKVIKVLQWLRENDKIIEHENKLQWKKQTSMDL
ncbi:MAG: RecQ family ATP-dependent DNA helicase [Bacteroidales bacterium]|nr:RecQ family ATP-dependent DNA helicase [Bacteroidales bacterium]MCF8344114.1 RecQ family ATP-dependent DNA helicase [Bacteroidales bacterium]MCF8352225.1 RecQ family ATP-dependent DNA helicase [Bacteroidales bacterium]MCF8375711.1 RecQ family ATP-dependent DNA helicase [Bacteroidales bacterium]MCF8400311.1 RecQ family ATP-dependent DNA helicase [Bacteroidales bacterium]